MKFIFKTNFSINIEAMASHGSLTPDEMIALLAIHKAIEDKIITPDAYGLFVLPLDLFRLLHPSMEFRVYPHNLLRSMRKHSLLGGHRKKYKITELGYKVIHSLLKPNDSIKRQSNKKKINDMSPYLFSSQKTGLFE